MATIALGLLTIAVGVRNYYAVKEANQRRKVVWIVAAVAVAAVAGAINAWTPDAAAAMPRPTS